MPMVLPGKTTAQGRALAPIAVATRPQGAPLTVMFAVRGCRARRTGYGPVLQVRSSAQRNGGYRQPAEAGSRSGGGGRARRACRPRGTFRGTALRIIPAQRVLAVRWRVPLVQLAHMLHGAVLLVNGRAEKESNRATVTSCSRLHGVELRAWTVDRFVDRVVG
jgi:hypothetical protein